MNTCTAFIASHRLASGEPEEVSEHLRKLFRRNPQAPCLVIDDHTGGYLDLDATGNILLPREALPPDPQQASRGRPRLGVVAREVTLLPRHWEWLSGQAGGASMVLRRLVDAASDHAHVVEHARTSLQACQRAMAALASSQPQFEAVCTALRKGDFFALGILMHDWPEDIRQYLETFIATAWYDACAARTAQR